MLISDPIEISPSHIVRPNGLTVRYAPGIYEKMLASVGSFEPEHYAILGGRLDDPFYVTDFMPMPPALDNRGGYRSSTATVTLNGPFIEYYLNTSLVPFGKYVLGAMHSHPGGMSHLSGGAPGSGYGDIPSMRAHLEAAARHGEPWHNFIAPIVTYPGDNPRVNTWVVRLDTPQPIAATSVWEEAHSANIEDILDLLIAQPDLMRLIFRHSGSVRAFLRSPRGRDKRLVKHLLARLVAARKRRS